MFSVIGPTVSRFIPLSWIQHEVHLLSYVRKQLLDQSYAKSIN